MYFVHISINIRIFFKKFIMLLPYYKYISILLYKIKYTLSKRSCLDYNLSLHNIMFKMYIILYYIRI